MRKTLLLAVLLLTPVFAEAQKVGRLFIQGEGYSSVFSWNGRNGDVLPLPGDYSFGDISGTLGVAQGGTGLFTYLPGDLLVATGPTTLSRIPIGAEGTVLFVSSGQPVWSSVSAGVIFSVFGRTGVILAQAGDYTAALVTNVPAGSVSATDVQAAIDELGTEKVPTTRNISTTSPLAGGGDLSADRTLSLGTVPVANGGTGITSTTPYAVLTGGTTATNPLQQVSGLGSSGQVLTSNGPAALPTWQTAEGDQTATTTTTNNTPTTIATLPLSDDTVYLVEARFVGRRTDAAGRSAYSRRALVYREAAGVATIEGTVDTDLTRESTATNDATISVSGNDLLLRVTGTTGHTIDWKVYYRIDRTVP